MAFTLDPDETLEHLRTVHTAFIDSSSIIYAKKAGVLDPLSAMLRLRTVSGVITEVGTEVPGIVIVEGANEDLSVDGQLVDLAVRDQIPVISEDRKLLMKADEGGIHGYNMLVMLELLLLRDCLSPSGWDHSRKRLLAAAHYSARVVHAGLELHWAVRKEVG